jgi:hypothetical protein
MAYGVLCIFAATATGYIWFLNHQAITLHGPGMRDLNGFQFISLFFVLLGVALLLRWKPALSLFVTITAAVGILLIIGSLLSIKESSMALLNIPFGAALLVPLTLMVRHKRSSRISLANGH